jgi:hypothetical protein
MAEYTPTTVSVDSLAQAAAAGSDLAIREQAAYSTNPLDPGTTTGIIAPPPDDYFLP